MARTNGSHDEGNMALGFILGAIVIGLAVVAYIVVARGDVEPRPVEMELTLPSVPAPQAPTSPPTLPPVEPPTLPTPTPPVT